MHRSASWLRPRFMTHPTRSRPLGRLSAPASPGSLAFTLLLAVLSTEFKFRARDATAAVGGAIDLQIVVEVVVWGVVGLWVVLQLRRRGFNPFARGGRAALDPTLLLLTAIVAAICVTTLWAPTPVAKVRAAQWAVLLVWAVLAVQVMSEQHDGVAALWRAIRRGVVGAAVVATALTPIFARAPELVRISSDPGSTVARYAWFAMHPLATGTGLGLAVVLVAGSLLTLDDRKWPRLCSPAVRIGTAVLLTLLLVATRARGALGGCVIAVGTLALLSARPRMRGGAVLAGLLLVAALLSGFGISSLETLVLRGQTLDQVRELSGRGEIFAVAVDLVSDRPLAGHGYLAGRTLFLDRIIWAPGESHNVWVEIALSLGVGGVVLWLAFLGRMAAQVVRRVRAGGEEGLVARELAAVGLFCLANGMVAEGFIAPGYEAGLIVAAASLLSVRRFSSRAHSALKSSASGADLLPSPRPDSLIGQPR